LQIFPVLLERLLQKDFSDSIRSGFEATGLFPLNKERVLAKMPRELAEEGNAVQQQLINKLSQIRYNPPATTRVLRPKKNEKLPPGAAYGGVSSDEEEEEIPPPAAADINSSSSSSDGDTDSDRSDEEDDDEEEEEEEEEEDKRRREGLKNVVRRLTTKRMKLTQPEEEEEEEDNPTSKDTEDSSIEDTPIEDPPEYRPGSFIACIYENGWYVGQVMEKEGEPEADEREDYVLVSFMMWTGPKGALLKWPERKDVLNVLKVTYCTIPIW
jgi:hypothetical protein